MNPHRALRDWFRISLACGAVFASVGSAPRLLYAQLPQEPVQIDHQPQFLFDNWIVDNHWAIRYKRQAVQRVYHQPQRHPKNPLMTHDSPSYAWVVRDDRDELFRMYYQANFRVDGDGLADPDRETLPSAKTRGRKYRTHIAYAESKDGINWTRPDLKLFDWHDRSPNNIVIGRAGRKDIETCAPCLPDLPEHARRGYRHVMLYRAKGRGGKDVNGIRLAGSRDGIHWQSDDDIRIAHLASDHHNTVSWDARRGEFVMFCRGKHIYRAFGETMLDTGASRRISRMSSSELWSDWLDTSHPQTVLVPDEIDQQTHFNFFYGMPTRVYAGVYWGFLEPFRMNDFIHTELALSRDGIQWHRFPGRPKFIDYGPDGAWDDEMIFVSPSWVEVGDEWWFYYAGWNGPHGTTDRDGAIGLATVRKEGLISIRGPAGGGVVCTRRLIWPGGDLVINADAATLEGEITVRVSDAGRRPIAGFNYQECMPVTGNAVRQQVRWNGRSMSELTNQEVRLEFQLRNADLFSFVADSRSPR